MQIGYNLRIGRRIFKRSAPVKVVETYGVIDSDVKAVLTASSHLVDFIMMGDSNQIYGGNGWDEYLQKSLTDRYGMYGTGLISANEGNGVGGGQGHRYNRINGSLLGTIDTQPAPFDDVFKSITSNQPAYLAAGATYNYTNNILLLYSDCPLSVAKGLKFRLHYANFASGGGTLYPRVRLEQSPYSGLTAINTVNCTAASDEMTHHDLTIPANVSRTQQIGYKWSYAETMNGKLFVTFVHAFDPVATSGISAGSFFFQGGASLLQMKDTLDGRTLNQLSHYFSILRNRQIDLGQASPKIVIRINSGLNDRAQVDDTAATYKVRLQALIDKYKAIWNHNSWNVNELYFVLTPSHRVSDPDGADLISYREKAKEISLETSQCSFIDFNQLMTYSEAIANGWYQASGTDTNHLTPAGYAELSEREVNALLGTL